MSKHTKKLIEFNLPFVMFISLILVVGMYIDFHPNVANSIYNIKKMNKIMDAPASDWTSKSHSKSSNN